MKERPILFNADMVRAVIAGRKTQTRRPFRVQPPDSWSLAKVLDDGRAVFDVADGCIPAADVAFVKSPFGAPGDLLWVREAWATHPLNVRAARTKPSLLPRNTKIYYRVNENENHFVWRPSIHMPRWASRLTLRVEHVWAERVQKIDESAAQREGWLYQGHNLYHVYDPVTMDTATHWFAELWNSIYADKGFGWNTNPLVWACEFEVVKGGN